MRPRKWPSVFPLSNIDQNTSTKIMEEGSSIVLMGRPLLKQAIREKALEIVAHSLLNGDTADYVCCNTPPYRIVEQLGMILEQKSQNSKSISDYKKYEFMIIDAFTSKFGCEDDIIKDQSNQIPAEIQTINAQSFSGIHSAVIESGRRRKSIRSLRTVPKLKTKLYFFVTRLNTKKQGREKPQTVRDDERLPHTMIYDSLSTLVDKGDVYAENELAKFYTHMISSEKAFQMITILIENYGISQRLSNMLQEGAECIFKIELSNASKLETRCVQSFGRVPVHAQT
jgi:hypothetical protein